MRVWTLALALLVPSARAAGCLTSDNAQYRSFARPSTDVLGMSDIFDVFYHILGRRVDARVQACGDYDDDGRVTMTDLFSLFYVLLGRQRPAAHHAQQEVKTQERFRMSFTPNVQGRRISLNSFWSDFATDHAMESVVAENDFKSATMHVAALSSSGTVFGYDTAESIVANEYSFERPIGFLEWVESHPSNLSVGIHGPAVAPQVPDVVKCHSLPIEQTSAFALCAETNHGHAVHALRVYELAIEAHVEAICNTPITVHATQHASIASFPGVTHFDLVNEFIKDDDFEPESPWFGGRERLNAGSTSNWYNPFLNMGYDPSIRFEVNYETGESRQYAGPHDFVNLGHVRDTDGNTWYMYFPPRGVVHAFRRATELCTDRVALYAVQHGHLRHEGTFTLLRAVLNALKQNGMRADGALFQGHLPAGWTQLADNTQRLERQMARFRSDALDFGMSEVSFHPCKYGAFEWSACDSAAVNFVDCETHPSTCEELVSDDMRTFGRVLKRHGGVLFNLWWIVQGGNSSGIAGGYKFTPFETDESSATRDDYMLAVLSDMLSARDASENLLWIIVDDLNSEYAEYSPTDPSSIKEPVAATRPNMRRIAARATEYTKAIATVAVCGASRSSLLTGRTPDSGRHYTFYGEGDRSQQQSMFEYLRRDGRFDVTGQGKLFHDADGLLSQRAFGSRSVPRDAYWNCINGNPAVVVIPQNEVDKGVDETAGACASGQHRDSKFADDGIAAFKAAARQGKRFAHAIGLTKPHLPFVSEHSDYAAVAGAGTLALPDRTFPTNSLMESATTPYGYRNFEITSYGLASDGSDAEENIARLNRFEPLADDTIRHLRRGYYASVRQTDRLIGRIWDELDASGLLANTTVVVVGDHGFSLGEQNRYSKHTTRKMDAHVPLLVYVPGSTPGKYEHPVSLLDVVPTSLSALGELNDAWDACDGDANRATCRDGRVVLPVPETPAVAINQFLHGGTMGYSIFTPDHLRFSAYADFSVQTGTTWQVYTDANGVPAMECFNHTADPREMNNIIGSMTEERKTALMAQLMAAFPHVA